MAKLTHRQKESLNKKEFALPAKHKGDKGSYPIEDAAHARNALARIVKFGTSAEKATVRTKVHKKFPSIKEIKK